MRKNVTHMKSKVINCAPQDSPPRLSLDHLP